MSYNHRNPTYQGCTTSSGFFKCKDHYRNDEKNLWVFENNYGGAADAYVGDNAFVFNGATASYASCRKMGWNAVLAAKTWHGRFGFEHSDRCNDYYFSESCEPCGLPGYDIGENCPAKSTLVCTFLPYQAPQTTKYCQITANGSATFGVGAGTTGSAGWDIFTGSESGFTTNISVTVNVGKNSGLVWGTCSLSNTSGSQVTGSDMPTAYTAVTNALISAVNELCTLTCVGYYDAGDPMPVVDCGNLTVWKTCDCSDPLDPCITCSNNLECGTYYRPTSSINNDYNWSKINTWNGASLIADTCCAGCGGGAFGNASMTHTDTNLSYNAVLLSSGIFNVNNSYVSVQITVDLGDPFFSDDVNASCESMLAQWPLDNTRQWRTDTDFWNCPTIRYSEIEDPIDPSGYVAATIASVTGYYTSSNPTGVTGELMGIPMPLTASYTGSNVSASFNTYYNAYHPNFNWVATMNCGFWEWNNNGAYCSCGENATECPPYQIVNDSTKVGCPSNYGVFASAGGLRFYNGGYLYSDLGEQLFVRKYAELFVFSRPSVNWNRPMSGSGYKDTLTRDSASQDCSTAGTYSDILYITNPASSSYDLESRHINNRTGIFVLPAGNELWASYNEPSESYWNNAGKKYDFVQMLWGYDYRDYQEVIRVNTALGSLSAYCQTRITQSSTPYLRPITTALKTVQSTQDYVDYTPCKAIVFSVEPSESRTTWTRHVAKFIDLPRVTCDYVYGSLVRANGVQWMTDPFWWKYLPYCDATGSDGTPLDTSACGAYNLSDYSWEEDVGAVQAIDPYTNTDSALGRDDYIQTDAYANCVKYHRYFPMRPLVEARTGPPTDPCGLHDSMSLVSGMRKLGCETFITDQNAESGYVSNESNPAKYCEYCYPPANAYQYNQYGGAVFPDVIFPWSIEKKQNDCVDSNCRYSGVYQQNGGGEGVTILVP